MTQTQTVSNSRPVLDRELVRVVIVFLGNRVTAVHCFVMKGHKDERRVSRGETEREGESYLAAAVFEQSHHCSDTRTSLSFKSSIIPFPLCC